MKRVSMAARMSVMVLMLLAIAACTSTEPGERIEPVDEQSVRITPVALFEGEEQKYQPFLGYMTGAVAIDYSGSNQVMELKQEIWRNGAKDEEVGGSAIFFDEEEMKNGYHGEIIINMKERVQEGRKPELDMMVSMVGQSTSAYAIPWDPKLTGKSLIAHHESMTYPVDQAIPIWGIQATSTGELHTTDFTPDSLARTEYALIFTVQFLTMEEHSSRK